MLIQNDYFDLLVEGENVVIRPKKSGFPLKSFDAITREHPRFKIASFGMLRKALTETEGDHVIGTWLPDVEIMVTADKMTANAMINLSMLEFTENKGKIIGEVERLLDERGIIHGRRPFGDESFKPGEPIVVASGTPPEKGADAVITYMELPERKPIIREDGSADYYEMNFVTPVKEGDWLGQKIAPKDGIDGADVYGNKIPSVRGLDGKLNYDRKSVEEQSQGDSVVLRALHSGALEISHGVIGVGKQLIVSGDVGPETGSISFDGAVIIHGTVIQGFSVTATGDISIEGNEGVLNAKEVLSATGDIFIKGGVFGGGETVIEAQGDIFIKHANNCKLYGKNINVGLYLIGAEVMAERVLLDKNRGKIIGGHVEALHSIECAIAGNSHERETVLHAKGVDNDLLYREIQGMAKDLKERQAVLKNLEQRTAQFETNQAKPQTEAYDKVVETINTNRDAILELDSEIQLRMSKVRQAIPPTIEVAREAHPGVVIQVGNKTSTLHTKTNGVFKIIDGVLNV